MLVTWSGSSPATSRQACRQEAARAGEKHQEVVRILGDALMVHVCVCVF
jgi:hypothetical protein